MCAEAKTNRVSLVSPDLNMIEQLLDELWLRNLDRSVQPRNLRQLKVHKNIVWRHMLLVPPLYEAVFAAGEGHVCFLDKFDSSELI